jgi:CBS-domain-containing membrane protein
VESAFANDKATLSTEDIVSAISRTHSLSEIMKDDLEAMAKVYEKRRFKNASK